MEGVLRAHFQQRLVHLDKGGQEGLPGPDEVLGESLPGSEEHLVSDIALPGVEDLSNEVVLEELH